MWYYLQPNMMEEKQPSCMETQIPYFVFSVLKHNKVTLFHGSVAVSDMEKMSKIRQNSLLSMFIIPITTVILLYQDIF